MLFDVEHPLAKPLWWYLNWLDFVIFHKLLNMFNSNSLVITGSIIIGLIISKGEFLVSSLLININLAFNAIVLSSWEANQMTWSCQDVLDDIDRNNNSLIPIIIFLSLNFKTKVENLNSLEITIQLKFD